MERSVSTGCLTRCGRRWTMEKECQGSTSGDAGVAGRRVLRLVGLPAHSIDEDSRYLGDCGNDNGKSPPCQYNTSATVLPDADRTHPISPNWMTSSAGIRKQQDHESKCTCSSTSKKPSLSLAFVTQRREHTAIKVLLVTLYTAIPPYDFLFVTFKALRRQCTPNKMTKPCEPAYEMGISLGSSRVSCGRRNYGFDCARDRMKVVTGHEINPSGD